MLSLVALTAASAGAKLLHVTGKQTTITPSAKATKFLSSHNISVSAIGPATISSGSLTLPISRGLVGSKTLDGAIFHKGGVKFTKGTQSVSLRGFVLARIGHNTVLTARVGGTLVAVARVTKLTKSVTGKQAVVTGELTLSAGAARRINHRLGHHVVSAGSDLGSLTSTVTVA